jgi:hypothetical protein
VQLDGCADVSMPVRSVPAPGLGSGRAAAPVPQLLPEAMMKTISTRTTATVGLLMVANGD